MVTAPSVANFKHLTMVGSNTPACLLSQGLPLTKSRPIHFRFFHSGLTWASLWKALNFATRSVESWAALTARVLGITRRDLANSAIASCSREPWEERQWGVFTKERKPKAAAYEPEQASGCSHHAGRVVLQVNGKGRLYSAPTWDHRLWLQNSLHHTKGIV